MKVGELFVFLGIKVDDKQLKSFDNGLKDLTQQLDLTKIGAIAAVYAIDRFIESSVAGGVALYNFTQQTGDSAEALQQWQQAANAANPALGIDQVAQSIQTLQNNLVEIRQFGTGNASPFAWLQVDIGRAKDAFDVLEQVHERLKSGAYSPALATNLIQKMGLNPGFINILASTDEQFNKFMKDAQRSPDAIGKLKDLGTRIAELKYNLSAFKDNLVASSAPALNKLIDLLYAVGHIFATSIQGYKEFAKEFPTVTSAFVAGVGLMVVALNPLKATLTGLLLLMEDFYVYKKGGKSVFGELFGDKDNPSALGGNGAAGVGKPITPEDLKDRLSPDVSKKALRDQWMNNGSRYEKLSQNNDVTINNNIDMKVDKLHPGAEKLFIASESIDALGETTRQAMKEAQKSMNYGFTDQQYNGGGY